MLIEAVEEILRDIALAVLWLSAGILALSFGSSVAVLGIGSALRARAGRAEATTPSPAALCSPGPGEHP